MGISPKSLPRNSVVCCNEYKRTAFGCIASAKIFNFRRETGRQNIKVNCLAPGGVKTDMYVETARKYMPNAADWTNEQVEKVVSNWSPAGDQSSVGFLGQ